MQRGHMPPSCGSGCGGETLAFPPSGRLWFPGLPRRLFPHVHQRRRANNLLAGPRAGAYNEAVDCFEVIRKRRSVRVFTSQMVDEPLLGQILAAANAAPSAGNLQAYEIFVFTNRADRRALAEAALQQMFVAQAPVVLVFCANPERSAGRYRERGVRLYCVQDATIACTFAMLAATALGLATVWVGAFDDAAVASIVGREDLKPVAILPMGYAGETPAPTSRRSLADLVHWRR